MRGSKNVALTSTAAQKLDALALEWKTNRSRIVDAFLVVILEDPPATPEWWPDENTGYFGLHLDSVLWEGFMTYARTLHNGHRYLLSYAIGLPEYVMRARVAAQSTMKPVFSYSFPTPTESHRFARMLIETGKTSEQWIADQVRASLAAPLPSELDPEPR